MKDITKDVNEFLSRAVNATLSAYEKFMNGTMDKKEKENFLEDQKAGKIALSNIKTLIDMLSVSGIAADDDGRELMAMLHEASAEIDKYKEDHDE